MIKNYDPKEILFTFGVDIITGYAPGTFLTVEREVDTYAKVIGAGGEGTRVRNRNRSARITCTLLSTSSTNDILSALHIADEATGSVILPAMVKDNLGNTLIFGAQAWIVRPPNVEYSDDESPREWMFDIGELDMNVGGA